MINSKHKGNNFERKIVKLLNEYTDNKFNFFRTPNSGAFASTHKLINYSGDIQTEKDFDYSIECKSCKKFMFNDLFKNKKNLLDKWWTQADEEAKRVNKIPILIFTMNNDKIYTCFDLLNHNNFIINNDCVIYKNLIIMPMYNQLFLKLIGIDIKFKNINNILKNINEREKDI